MPSITFRVDALPAFWMVSNNGALSVDAHDIRLRWKAIAHPGDILDVDRSAANRLDRDSV